MAGSASAVRAGRAFVELYATDSQLRADLAKTSAFFNSWARAFATAGLAAVGAGLGVSAAMFGAAKAFADYGSELARASIRTGITVEKLSQLRYAAEQAGISFDELERGIIKMSRSIIRAGEGTAESVKGLQQLNLTVADLLKLSPDKQLELIADRLVKIQSPTARAAVAMELFGSRAGTAAAKFLVLVSQGGAGIAALMTRAEQLGLTISTKDAFAALEFTQRLADLWAVVKTGVFVIGGLLAPAIRNTTIAFTSGITALRNFIEAHRAMAIAVATALTGITAALVIGGSALVAFGVALKVASIGFDTLSIGVWLAYRALSVLTTALWAATIPLRVLTVLMTPVAGSLGLISRILLSLASAVLYPMSTLASLAKVLVGLGKIVAVVFEPARQWLQLIGLVSRGIIGILSGVGGAIITIIGGSFNVAAAIATTSFTILGATIRAIPAVIQGVTIALSLMAQTALISVAVASAAVGGLIRAMQSLRLVIVAVRNAWAVTEAVFAAGAAIFTPFGLILIVLTAIGAAIAIIAVMGKDIASGLASPFRAAAANIKAGFASIGNALLSPFRAVASYVQSIGGTIAGFWNSVIGKLSLPSFHLGNISLGNFRSEANGLLASIRDIRNDFPILAQAARSAFATAATWGGIASRYIGGAFQNVRQYLAGVWTGLKADSIEAFTGIRNAIAAEDWATAAQIAWAYLKIEWAKGSSELYIVWLTLKGKLMEAWSGLMEGIEIAWSYAKEYLSNWDGIVAGASKFMSWFKAAWTNVIDWLADKFASIKVEIDFADTEKQIRETGAKQIAKGKLTQADVDKQVADARAAAYDDLHKQQSDRDKGKDAAYAARQKAIDDAYKSAHPELVAQEEAARAKIIAAREDQRKAIEDAIAREKASAGSGSQERIDALKKKLADLAAKAAAEAAKPPIAPPEFKPIPDFDPDAASGALGQLQKSTASGTFNTDGLFGLGGTNHLAKIAEHTKRGADAADKTAKEVSLLAGRGGFAFA